MPITPPEKSATRRRVGRIVAALVLVVFALLLRRGLLVLFLGLKILDYTAGLDAWKGAVRHQTVRHGDIPVDVYGDSSGSPLLIVHGINATGKNSLDLVRISDALAQAGYQVFVPDFAEMKKQHLQPEEAGRIKSVFQSTGRDAAIACFSYGCGPALVAASDPEIRDRVRFILAFGGYYDIREALEHVITGPESAIAFIKWVYLTSNVDLLRNEADRTGLRTIAENKGQSPDPAAVKALSHEAQALLAVFTAATPEEFRARLAAAPHELRRRLDALSPSEVIANIHSRLILVHGSDDPVIPARQSLELAKAARAHGLACTVTLLRIYGHVQPVRPKIGIRTLFEFYLPETVRFFGVVNRLVSER